MSTSPTAYHFIRRDILEGINRYVLRHQEVGHFLTAVLSNDLKGAFAAADQDNLRAMFQVVSYCYNEIPLSCWGSPAAVKEWLEMDAQDWPECAAPQTAEEMRRQEEEGIWGWEQYKQDLDHEAGNGRCPCEICQSRWVGGEE